jgi:aspartyl-tRNA(Asn)/glutamyl-tRNA(Gln) amidotransferase subunit C
MPRQIVEPRLQDIGSGTHELPSQAQRRTRSATSAERRRAAVPDYHRLMISRSDVEHVAALARLGLTDEEIDRLVGQLSRILEAVGKLSEVDTRAVGPTAQVIALENVMRDDVARPGISREAALAEAPMREGALLRVPVVLEEGR